MQGHTSGLDASGAGGDKQAPNAVVEQLPMLSHVAAEVKATYPGLLLQALRVTLPAHMRLRPLM
jgi:hypothetical protein